MSLITFPPHVSKQVVEVFKHGKIGVCPGAIQIVYPPPSCPHLGEKMYCDRFTLVIPYGGYSVNFIIMFQSSSPDCPPDFIFPNKSFVDMDKINSLINWDASKPNSLLLVLKEYLHHYQKYQVSRLESCSRVQFEYSTLTQQTNIAEDDIEVFVSDNKKGPINFLIRLEESFDGIPPIYRADIGDDSVLLLVTFQGQEGSKISAKLYLPPAIENALAIPVSWGLPSFTRDGCLMDYVPLVQESLKKQVEMVAFNFEKRMEYLFVFLEHFEGCYLEFDRDMALKATFLFDEKGFHFLFHIELPHDFQSGKPSFTFRSIYHSFGEPYSITVMDYPYDQGWCAKTMLKKVIDFVKEYSVTFKRNSVKKWFSTLT